MGSKGPNCPEFTNLNWAPQFNPFSHHQKGETFKKYEPPPFETPRNGVEANQIWGISAKRIFAPPKIREYLPKWN